MEISYATMQVLVKVAKSSNGINDMTSNTDYREFTIFMFKFSPSRSISILS